MYENGGGFNRERQAGIANVGTAHRAPRPSLPAQLARTNGR